MPKQLEKTKYITLTSDIGFKYVFKRKENIKELIQDILNIKIRSLIFIDTTLEKRGKHEKESRLDVLVLVNSEIVVNVEMQQREKGNIIPRSIYYMSKLISKDIVTNEEYEKIKRHVMINIIDYQDEDKKLQTSYKLIEMPNINKVIDYIQIEKINLRSTEINNPRLKKWKEIFNAKEEEEMKKHETDEEKIARVAKLMEQLNADPEALALYEAEEKRKRDEVWMKAWARNKGREEGLEEGIKAGIEEGMTKGIMQNKRDNAINLLKDGISKSKICQYLNVTMNELNSLINMNS